ncbi:MAG: ABC transporter ATP-binding protein [Pseudomonadota bacterium]
MIQLRGLSKSFRRGGITRPIIRQVDFTLPELPGIAIIGRNGAGKSTLMRLIAGTMKPDAGRVVTNERISWPMGFSGGFHPALTGAQNARFVARVYGRNPQRLAEEVEAFAELGNAWNQPVGIYSTGMKARLAFSVSMAVNFDTYLVDEIIGVGDDAFRRKCRASFQRRMTTAKVLMISHSAPTLRQFCQAGLVLEHGRLTYHPDLDTALEAHEANLARPVAAA